MVEQAGFRKPNNGILLDPKFNAMTQYLDAKTIALLYPGKRVMKDTTDDQTKVASGPGVGIGYAGYEMTPAAWKPATRDTIYVTGDRIAVHSGSGYMIRAWIAQGQGALTKGQGLSDNDSSGCLVIDSSGNSTVATLEETTAATTSAAITAWVTVLKG
jgi:hypothetical protein